MTTPEKTPFEQAILNAIVEQFFVGIEVRTDYGTQRIDPQATKLADQLLRTLMPELVAALSKKIDLDKLAEDIAAGLADKLVSLYWSGGDDKEKLRKKVIEKYAEIKANKMIEKESAN